MAINTEVTTYVSAITSAGGTISQAHIDAHDVFVSALKTASIWAKLYLVATMAGNQIAAGRCNLKAPAGLETLGNVNFVSGDYTSSLGFSISSNTNKYLDTGFIPDTHIGANSYQNISFGTYFTASSSGTASSSFMIGDSPASGDSNLLIATRTGSASNIGSRLSSISHSAIPDFSSAAFNAASGDSCSAGARYGPLVTNALTLNTNFTLFASMRSTVRRYAFGSLGFFFIGTFLTTAEQKTLALAVNTLMIALGRGDTRDRAVFFGDSITLGQTSTTLTSRWAYQVASAFNLRETNIGIASSRLRPSSDIPYSGWTRRDDLATWSNVSKVFLAYGINDYNNDANANGDDTIVADLISKYGTIISQLITQGVQRKNITLLSLPYTTATAANPVKTSKYNTALQNLAITYKLRWADINTAMTNNGGATLVADGLHPNDAGHGVIGTTVIAAPLTDSTAPAAPVLSATSANTVVYLSAVAPADSDTVGVKFFRDGVLINDVAATPGQTITYTDTGQANGIVHAYTAKAYDPVPNESVASAPVSIAAKLLDDPSVAAVAAAILFDSTKKIKADSSGNVTSTNGITTDQSNKITAIDTATARIPTNPATAQSIAAVAGTLDAQDEILNLLNLDSKFIDLSNPNQIINRESEGGPILATRTRSDSGIGNIEVTT